MRQISSVNVSTTQMRHILPHHTSELLHCTMGTDMTEKFKNCSSVGCFGVLELGLDDQISQQAKFDDR